MFSEIIAFAMLVFIVLMCLEAIPDKTPREKMEEEIDENIRKEAFHHSIRERWGDCDCGFLFNKEDGLCIRCGARYG